MNEIIDKELQNHNEVYSHNRESYGSARKFNLNSL